MKIKLLSINRLVKSADILQADFDSSPAISDFDAVIVDPSRIYPAMFLPPTLKTTDGGSMTDMRSDGGHGKRITSMIDKRKGEVANLLTVTQGLLVCFLRKLEDPLAVITLSGLRYVKNYSWLPNYATAIEGSGMTTFVLGDYFRFKDNTGNHVTLVSQAHPFAQYFRAFNNEIGFEATIEVPEPLGRFVKVVATNKVGEIIACEIPIGGGKIIFLPLNTSRDRDKETGVLLSCIRRMMGYSYATPSPAWVKDYILPGETKHEEEIARLGDEISRLEEEKHKFEEEREYITRFKGLLYEKGKMALEPLVREAFRVMGFGVLEPDNYPEEYDVYIPDSEMTVIGEVEGTDNSKIDVEKVRQLMDYLDQEAKKGIQTKGILIGNAQGGQSPNERNRQFTDAAIKRGTQLEYCLITTCQLYELTYRIFSGIDEPELLKMRQSILSCVGEYSPEVTVE